MLSKFQSGKSPLVNLIVTGSKTLLYYYDVPSKLQLKIKVIQNEEMPTMVKQFRSLCKRMIAVFFSKRGIFAQAHRA